MFCRGSIGVPQGTIGVLQGFYRGSIGVCCSPSIGVMFGLEISSLPVAMYFFLECARVVQAREVTTWAYDGIRIFSHTQLKQVVMTAVQVFCA